jgi:hypothetical protein
MFALVMFVYATNKLPKLDIPDIIAWQNIQLINQLWCFLFQFLWFCDELSFVSTLFLLLFSRISSSWSSFYFSVWFWISFWYPCCGFVLQALVPDWVVWQIYVLNTLGECMFASRSDGSHKSGSLSLDIYLCTYLKRWYFL